MKKILRYSQYYLQLHRAFQFFNRHNIIILMYHGFSNSKRRDGIENYQGKHISIELFRSQISYLKKNYTVISLEKYINCCTEGKNIPKNSVVITIDDGYRSNYILAFPIFKEFDIPATIFLTTDFIDNKNFLWVDRLEYALNHTKAKDLKLAINGEEICLPLVTKQDKISCDRFLRINLKSMDYVSIEKIVCDVEDKTDVKLAEAAKIPPIYAPLEWDEILEMTRTPKINIGSHTHNHLILARYDNAVIQNETVLSKKIIESKTGVNARLFCYPNGAVGDFNDRTKQIIKESGYSCALTTVSGMNSEFSDLYELKRIGVGNTDLKSFIMNISGLKHFISRIKND